MAETEALELESIALFSAEDPSFSNPLKKQTLLIA
jgi:hypothetical protein